MFLAPVLSWLHQPPSSHSAMRQLLPLGMACAIALCAVSAHASQAAITEVNQLLERGKIQDAAQRVQSHLKANSGDVQMRFLQGVIAAEQQKYDQAIQVFTALTQDYPSLPEPYNNLAVLHAAKGDERKAAQVLEQAIRTNPSYATAHENLGDLYARMASDAYAKALQLDSSRQAIQPKLSLIRQIFPGQATATPPATTAVATTASPKETVVPSPAVAAVPVSPPPAAAPERPAMAAVATAAAPREPRPVDERKHAVAAVEKSVNAWAQAWAQQNMSAYYAAYSSQFTPANGSTLASWKAERKERIVGKPAITVEVRDLKVQLQGERATASFRQHYASGGYKATTRKQLRMQREGDNWRILREDTGR